MARFPAVLRTMAIVLSVVWVCVGCARRPAQVRSAPVTATQDDVPPPPMESSPGGSAENVARELAPVFFAFDSHSLSAEARAILDGHARWLRERQQVRITIEGHCDERGTVEYNLALGERRAIAARNYLVRSGVPAERIDVVSYGKEQPLEAERSEAAWAANRRAHPVVR